MPFEYTHAGSLAERGIASLREFYGQGANDPSEAVWDSLRAIASTIQSMADGTAERRVFLSSCDPGQGKSQTVIHTTAALVADPAYAHVGVLIGVGRLTEAVAIAQNLRTLGLPDKTLAVATSDEEVNAEGTTGNSGVTLTTRDDVPQAQVLIITQQRIDRLTRDCSLSEVHALHCQGEPRAVRIWDEAWLPGVAVSLESWDLLSAPEHPPQGLLPHGGRSETSARGTRQGPAWGPADYPGLGSLLWPQ